VRTFLGIGALAIGLAAGAQSAAASILLAPSAGARDTAMAGTNVAAPSDLMTAFFQNPAGLSLQTAPAATFGTGFIFADYEIKTPSGYDQTSSPLVLAPTGGFAMPLGDGGWRVGFGMFGALGTKYDFPADPAQGVPSDYYSELAVITFSPTITRALTSDLSVGVQINPLYGKQKTRVGPPGQQVRWTIDGPGIQGALGLLYRINTQWQVAVSYKTPGEIYMGGLADVVSTREDLRLNLDVPQQVMVGAAWRPRPEWLLTLAGRWSDTSVWENSELKFENTPTLDEPFATDARDVFRIGAGVEYRLRDDLVLRGGAAMGQATLGASSITPLAYDVNDIVLASGFGWTRGRWIIDGHFGAALGNDRWVTAPEARAIPGRFGAGGLATYWQLTRRFN
jgi:long-subunit fatty acid transport protein